jgi:hypothetical protein
LAKCSFRAVYDRLSKLSGDNFDRDFAQAMVDDHNNEIRKFEKQAKKKNDPAADFANETLPTLRKHLEMAQSLPVGKWPLTYVAAASASRHRQANCVCVIRLNNADGKSARLRALQESGGGLSVRQFDRIVMYVWLLSIDLTESRSLVRRGGGAPGERACRASGAGDP